MHLLILFSCLLSTFLCLAQALEIVPGVSFDRFITIWLENQDYSKAILDPHFKALRKSGILLTRYFGHTHPSQPNYLAALAGDYFGLDHDDRVRVPASVATVVDLLESRNISWTGYFEGLPGPGYLADGSAKDKTNAGPWDYVRKHNPFMSFDSITSNGHRLLKIRSFKQFQRDFDAGEVPQFVFMSPDMLHDGHNTSLAFATDFAHDFIKPLLDPSAFGEGERTLIALTFDESEAYDKPNQIATLLLGSAVPVELRGTEDKTFHTHYSILSSIEANWALPNLGRYDVGANVWSFMMNAGGGRIGWRPNQEPENAATVDNSVSYPGPLSTFATETEMDPDTDERVPVYPAPNLLLKGVSGLGVLHKVQVAFAAHPKAQTPYDGSGRVVDGDINPPVYGPQAENVR